MKSVILDKLTSTLPSQHKILPILGNSGCSPVMGHLQTKRWTFSELPKPTPCVCIFFSMGEGFNLEIGKTLYRKNKKKEIEKEERRETKWYGIGRLTGKDYQENHRKERQKRLEPLSKMPLECSRIPSIAFFLAHKTKTFDQRRTLCYDKNRVRQGLRPLPSKVFCQLPPHSLRLFSGMADRGFIIPKLRDKIMPRKCRQRNYERGIYV